jgi:hypothetical protein
MPPSAHHAIRARTPLTGRRLKTESEGRVCVEQTCDTRLTRYNRKERCFRHQVRKYPRIRGR